MNVLVLKMLYDEKAGIESIHSAGMMSVGINVNVTSIQPDIALKSTAELKYNNIVDSMK